MKRYYSYSLITLLSVIVIGSTIRPAISFADTAPPSGTPSTVSADPLPTVQINGVVRSQVVVGNKVYVTGSFTKARPAGSALGQNEVIRQHLLAYDIRTGILDTTFGHSLNAQGWSITASPNGTRIYVGGDFTSVDGQAVNRIAAFDTATGSRVASFTQGPSNGSVRSLAANNSYVYLGGSFTQVSGGATRSRLAAYSSTGALTAWAPSADRSIAAMVMTTDGSKIVVGGSFSKLNWSTYYGLGALSSASPGTALPWASQNSSFKLRFSDTNSASGVTSLSTNGSAIFLTAFHYMPEDVEGSFEGRAAISPNDGSLLWANDCHGDTYSAFPIGDVLYSAGHSHDCTRIGTFPQNTSIRVLAETMKVNGTNAYIYQSGYSNLGGVPKTTQLNWYPFLQPGSYTGQNQAAWSITGNSQYVSAGGEFTKAGTMAQQGLVRYAIASIAPNKIGPSFAAGSIPTSPVDSYGRSKLQLPSASDVDNGILRYRLYRDNGSTPIYEYSLDTRFWKTPSTPYYDDSLVSGSVHTYRLVASDQFGNSASINSALNITLTGTDPSGITTKQVDDPSTAIAYSGSGWVSDQKRTAGEIGGGIHYTTSNGATATYSFTGTAVSLVSYRCNNLGNIAISIDGGPAVTVSANNGSPTTSVRQVLFTKFGMNYGNHSIKITKLDGTYMVLDALLVDPPRTTTPTTIDDTNASIGYSGLSWVSDQKRTAGEIGGGIHFTSSNGSSATYTFYGTGVSFVSYRCNNLGNIRVSIDGGAITTTVNANNGSPTTSTKQTLYSIAGMSFGKHTIELTKIDGTYMIIDALVVTQ